MHEGERAGLNGSGSKGRWAEVSRADLRVELVAGRGNSQYRALRTGTCLMRLKNRNKIVCVFHVRRKVGDEEMISEGKWKGGWEEQAFALHYNGPTVRFWAEKSFTFSKDHSGCCAESEGLKRKIGRPVKQTSAGVEVEQNGWGQIVEEVVGTGGIQDVFSSEINPILFPNDEMKVRGKERMNPKFLAWTTRRMGLSPTEQNDKGKTAWEVALVGASDPFQMGKVNTMGLRLGGFL